ncbi:MAG: serine protein kinase PrkA [Candidatus Riflebacteria bacterium]|nr:serine protein kinase PrkA [Candidatus Riflebacteria bacterium]
MGKTLTDYMHELRAGKHRFENVFRSVSRMILEDQTKVEKVTVNGKSTFDYKIFREGRKPVIGMFDLINSFVSYVKDAAENGSSREMAFVLVGEPGNGKTFFVDKVCDLYRNFLSKDNNVKYTFRFKGLEKLGKYGKLNVIESQTYEDPVLLAMNLYPGKDENKKFISGFGFSENESAEFFRNYRALGACSEYILNDLRVFTNGDYQKIMTEFIDIVPVPLSGNLGTITGKYQAKDKITSSGADLCGEESVQRLLYLADSNNPYRYDLRRGVLARVAGGGIHFSDELFKNKTDLVQIYLGVIQNREIEINAYKWPMDTLIIATSNIVEYQKFIENKEQAPIYDRCKVFYVPHNTDYKLQSVLTRLSIGNEKKTTILGKDLHEDPNLSYALSIPVVLTRLPQDERLTPREMLHLAAGEVAGEKSIKTLVEIIDELSRRPKIKDRFGHSGIGQRGLGRAVQQLLSLNSTHEDECMFAGTAFESVKREIYDNLTDKKEQEWCLKVIEVAEGLYKEKIKTEIFNAYMNDPEAIKKEVMNYVNMVVVSADNVGPDKIVRIREGNIEKPLKIDETFINGVEQRLGLNTREAKEQHRAQIRAMYARRVTQDPSYCFMDNEKLKKAVTEYRLNTDMSGAGSLAGALANPTNEDNKKLFDRLFGVMIDKLGYCKSCARKTLEFYCKPDSNK